jgi:hypothetical protein
MGQKLMKFYDLAKAEGGFPMQMRLAMKTGMASPVAEKAPDSPENIQKFKVAFKEITGKDAPIF